MNVIFKITAFIALGLVCILAVALLSIEPVSQRIYRDLSGSDFMNAKTDKRKHTFFFDIKAHRPTLLIKFTPKGWRLRPNCRGVIRKEELSGQDIRIRTNKLGLRGPDLSVKRPDEYRILLIGDSITLSDYTQESDTIAARLEKQLQRSGLGVGRKISVVNGGIMSLGLKDEIELLKEILKQVNPDIVIEMLYLNDANPSMVMREPPWPLNKWSVSRALWQRGACVCLVFRQIFHEMALKHLSGSFAGSLIQEKIRNDWKKDPDAFRVEVSRALADWGYAWHPNAWKTIRRGLLQLKEMGQKEGFELAVALLPVRYQVEADYLENWPQKKFEETAHDLKIDGVDILPGLRNHWAENKSPLFYDRCHMTPEGNRTTAEIIESHLVAERSTDTKHLTYTSSQRTLPEHVEQNN